MSARASPPDAHPLVAPVTLADAAPRAGIGPGLRRRLDYLGVLPFAVFAALFLLWPTVLVVWGAFQAPDGGLTLSNLAQAAQGSYLQTFVTSVTLSAITALNSSMRSSASDGRPWRPTWKNPRYGSKPTMQSAEKQSFVSMA